MTARPSSTSAPARGAPFGGRNVTSFMGTLLLRSSPASGSRLMRPARLVAGRRGSQSMPQSSHQKWDEVAGDRLGVMRLAAPVRQSLDPPGIGHQQDQRAEHELIAPVYLRGAALRKRARERRDDLLRNRIENLRNDAALERV